MFALHLVTAILVVFTGLYVLARGDWKKFKLKYAGVAISTAAGIWIMLFIMMQPDGVTCTLSSMLCLSYGIYGVARNIAFIFFHIAFGRDAISFKKRERRSTKKEVRSGRDTRKVA